MILIDQYIDFLIDNNINPEQYLLLHCIKDERRDLIERYKNAFPTDEGSMINKTMIIDLVDKGFLVKSGKGFKLGDKLLEIFVTPEVAVDEIYNIYPPFINSDNGVSIPLISMDKRIFKELYIPKICGNVYEHKEVLKDIQYGIDNNLLRMGINKFLTSEQWKSLRKLRQQTNPTQNKAIDLTDENF